MGPPKDGLSGRLPRPCGLLRRPPGGDRSARAGQVGLCVLMGIKAEAVLQLP